MDGPDSTRLAEEFEALAARLEALAVDHEQMSQVPDVIRERLRIAAGRLAVPSRKERRRFNKVRRKFQRADRRQADELALEQTGIRLKRKDAVFQTPHLLAPSHVIDTERELAESENEGPRVAAPRCCYVCKTRFDTLHFFYDQMCADCAAFNWDKRHQTANLAGRVALLTGGRVKIGYHVGIKLLRAGARLIVTTRFPRDAARRYAAEHDFGDWKDRLEIFGLDLRHTPSVEALCEHLVGHLDRLDFVINNACQTVRRPPGFYRHLLAPERQSLADLPASERPLLESGYQLRERLAPGRELLAPADRTAEHLTGAVGLSRSAELAALPLLPEDHDESERLFPTGALDQDEQQVDLRGRNSWRLSLADVSTVELVEVQLVNAVAPYVLNARLKPLMARTAATDKHIVNVSAVEGQFYRRFKTDKHPHTNMAKAALNMMTRTSAVDYIKSGIHMNAVDTGWVTDEDPAEIASQKREEQGFTPPLDIVDGAARILDPIFAGLNSGDHVWGQFLKDYGPVDW